MVLAEAIHTKTQKMMIIPAGRVVNEEIMQIINFFSQQRQISGRVAVQNPHFVDHRKSA